MSDHRSSGSPHAIIEREKEIYREEKLPEADPDWPPDVRAVYNELQDRLFEMGLEVQAVTDACGIGDHNIHSRFRYFVGKGMKEWVLTHRLQLAKRLLSSRQIPVTRIAFGIGYENPSGFSATFKRWEGHPPSEYQERKEQWKEID